MCQFCARWRADNIFIGEENIRVAQGCFGPYLNGGGAFHLYRGLFFGRLKLFALF